MADSLYFSLWFSDFGPAEMLVRALSVMRQFPFSKGLPGITYYALHPVSWNEPTIFEQPFHPGATPEEAIAVAADLLHEDYAYVFEAKWDLWTPQTSEGAWTLAPSTATFIVRGCKCCWILSIVLRRVRSPARGCYGRSRAKLWRRNWWADCRECSDHARFGRHAQYWVDPRRIHSRCLSLLPTFRT